MSININHKTNTFSSESGQFIFGTGIVPNIENAVYSNSFSGKYFGDGSSLTGIVGLGGGTSESVFVNSSLVTVTLPACGCGGPTYLCKGSGSFQINTGGSIVSGANYSAVIQGSFNRVTGRSDYSTILNGQINLIKETSCFNTILNGTYNCISGSTQNTLVHGNGNSLNHGSCSFINGNANCNYYSYDSFINGNSNTLCLGCYNVLFGCCNNILNNNCFSTVFGCRILLDTGASNHTLYARNFCSYQGNYYGSFVGDGSQLINICDGSGLKNSDSVLFYTTGASLSGSSIIPQIGTAQVGLRCDTTDWNGYQNAVDYYNAQIIICDSLLAVCIVNNPTCFKFLHGGVLSDPLWSANVNTNLGVQYLQIWGSFGQVNGSPYALVSCNYVAASNDYAAAYHVETGINFTSRPVVNGVPVLLSGEASGGGGGTLTPQQKSILLTGATGFTQYHQAKNVGILAQNCFVGETINSGYLLLDKGGENETNNLFAISSSTYCVGTFSVMLIGMGYINQGGPITTSMRIDGTYGNGVILNQVKNIYYRTQDLNDANVVIEDNNFRIAVSGVSGIMVWSSKIDLLDMNGYD